VEELAKVDRRFSELKAQFDEKIRRQALVKEQKIKASNDDTEAIKKHLRKGP